MNVYVPLAIGQSIAQQSYASLAKQTLQCSLIPCCTPGVQKDAVGRYPSKAEKVAGEITSRNLALDLIAKSGKEYVIMQDRDIVYTDPSHIENALKFLDAHHGYGALAFKWKDVCNSSHVMLQAILLRVSALEGILFRADERLHTCVTFADDMRAAGYVCDYFPTEKQAIVEIK